MSRKGCEAAPAVVDVTLKSGGLPCSPQDTSNTHYPTTPARNRSRLGLGLRIGQGGDG